MTSPSQMNATHTSMRATIPIGPWVKTSLRHTPLQVAVGIPEEPHWNEVAKMVIATLQQCGIATLPVADGDERAFNAETLLLVGSGRWFPQFEQLSKRLNHRRPRIVLWHLQPLPPPIFTRRASELGQKLLRAEWNDLLGSLGTPLDNWLPLKQSRRLLLQRIYGVQIMQEFERIGGPEYGNIGWDDLCMIFQEAAWLQETCSQSHSWIDAIATDTPTRVAFLRQHNIPAHFVPLGYHQLWGNCQANERDIDVLFVGNLNSPSRVNVVPEVLQRLQEWGYSTELVNPLPIGKDRTQLLQRTRIVLNVLRLPWEFPGLRLLPSAACGALVVSNEAVQIEPFQAGVHFVPAPKTRMAESIAYLLDHEEERQRKANIAKRELETHFPMVTLLHGLLNLSGQTGHTAKAA